MSVVTNILLCTSIDDSGVLSLSDWLAREHSPACHLKMLHPHATGDKAMEVDVFGVAVNYLNVDTFINAFKATPWERSLMVHLLVKHEDWDTFQLYTP